MKKDSKTNCEPRIIYIVRYGECIEGYFSERAFAKAFIDYQDYLYPSRAIIETAELDLPYTCITENLED